MPNPYTELELPNFASIVEIKRAYRRMALKHHPDRGGKIENMQIINRAYDFLSKNKFQYDNTLKESMRPVFQPTGSSSFHTFGGGVTGTWTFSFTQ